MVYKNFLKRWGGGFVLAVLLSIGVSSCYYDYGLSTSDYDAILTTYDKGTEFTKYKTYILPDTVFHLVGENDDDISRQYDGVILSTVKANMNSRGFVEIEYDENNLPDIVVTVSIATATWTGGGWYYPWYPGWGWGYYPGWGYPGGSYYYTYETGTVFVDFIDVNDIDANNPDKYVRPRWNGTLQGLVSSSSQSNATRIRNSIDRMFYQSPYLVSGNE